ncbi:MAG: Ig-like domain-containing protein [Treponema sp.]|jgi:hypothetical protein|nr:Ig-like domain-containing protein [Treponema sp.]
MRKMYKLPVFCAAVLVLIALTGCDMTLSEEGPQADGIAIYSGREILNGREVEIVAKRAQQLGATSLSGGVIVWESSNPSIVEVVDQTGSIRVGQSLGKKAVISASLRDNPSIRAEVTFVVRDLR